MAGPRKVHIRTDLTVPMIGHQQAHCGKGALTPDVAPPAETKVRFDSNPSGGRTCDFAAFYGRNIDHITYAIQKQIERFLAKQDADLETNTVLAYATTGCRSFLDYMALRAATLKRTLSITDIDHDVIGGYLRHLMSQPELSRSSRKLRYDHVKAVLQALARRGLFHVIAAGDSRTFPANPFPNSARHVGGEAPLSRRERQAFTAAVKTAVMPIFEERVNVTAELLSYALLVVALHTGRNLTPLIEMSTDCLRPHPKENTEFLVLWKRRGHNTSKVALRGETPVNDIEAMPSVKLPVVRLIRRVISLSEPLQSEAPAHVAGRVWLYRSRQKKVYGQVAALTVSAMHDPIRKLVQRAALVDADGAPLRINVSRLRKTFANRVFELLDGDLGGTALALGNTPAVAGRNYLRPGEDARRNWKFLGETLTSELQSGTVGASELTPAGRCTDPVGGQYAPKGHDPSTCFAFLNCLRCRNYVVTGDDLHRLFSFYWRVLRERQRMDRSDWEKHYAHIPRLIERDVIDEGIRKKIFKQSDVEDARLRARLDPHPFWRSDVLESLETFREPQELTA